MYVIRVKVLPSDASVDIERVVDSVTRNLGADAQVRSKTVEPIAFGISAAILDIIAPEKEGSIDTVERLVSTATLVGQCEMMGVSRMSSRLQSPRS